MASCPNDRFILSESLLSQRWNPSRSVIKGTHQSWAIQIKPQAIYQIYKTTVFNITYMIQIYIYMFIVSGCNEVTIVKVLASRYWKNFKRLILQLSGDVERNPGPTMVSITPKKCYVWDWSIFRISCSEKTSTLI